MGKGASIMKASLVLAVAVMALCYVAAHAQEKEYPTPLGEDDEAENFDLDGPRSEPPQDVYLQTEAGEEKGPAKKLTSKSEPLIELSGGGEFHVGEATVVKTTGGAINVKKGSKLAVSQLGKLVTHEGKLMCRHH